MAEQPVRLTQGTFVFDGDGNPLGHWDFSHPAKIICGLGPDPYPVKHAATYSDGRMTVLRVLAVKPKHAPPSLRTKLTVEEQSYVDLIKAHWDAISHG